MLAQDAYQLGKEHDAASGNGPAADAVGHPSHHLQDEPAQAHQRDAEQAPPQTLGCHKPGSTPAAGHHWKCATNKGVQWTFVVSFLTTSCLEYGFKRMQNRLTTQ